MDNTFEENTRKLILLLSGIGLAQHFEREDVFILSKIEECKFSLQTHKIFARNITPSEMVERMATMRVLLDQTMHWFINAQDKPGITIIEKEVLKEQIELAQATMEFTLNVINLQS
ncbi:MAG: hypothetical protein RIQ89_412 [Bacteroidota bacterium]|jgi:hypothetical protein